MKSSLRSVHGTVLLAVWVLVLPQESLSGCVFGANNTEDLALRNATILREMNDTLMFYLNQSNTGIRQNLFLPLFSIPNRLLKWHNVTSETLLPFTKDGKLLNLTWENETSDLINQAPKIPSYILKDFVKPAHQALQNISVKYSFSYGIFRPDVRQLHFTGLENSTTLTTNCSAGTYMGVNMTTNVQYYDLLGIKNSTRFAVFATMLEQGIDAHFRIANSPFTNDFVRVNVLNASMASDKYNTLVQAELYFLNHFRNWTEVLNRLQSLPPTPYINSRNFKDNLNVWGYTLFEIFNTQNTTTTSSQPSSAITSTTVPPSSTLNTTSASTSTSTPSTTNTTSNTSQSTSAVNSSTTPLMQNSTTTQLANTTNLTNSSTALTTSNFTSTSSPTLSTSNSTSSYTSHNTPTPSASTSAGSLQSTNASTLTLKQDDTTAPANTTTVPSTASTTPVLPGNVSLTRTSVSPYTFSVTTNSAQNMTPTVNSPRNTPSIKLNGTTYDPDPRFLPVVGVIKNVYNDEILLRRNSGKFIPLVERPELFTVTLPAAFVLVIIIVGCVLCLQCGG